MRKLLLVLVLALPLFGQTASRFDPSPATMVSPNTGPGVAAPLLALPGAAITLCGYPANGVPCTNLATSYTSATGATSCSSALPVTPANGGTCGGFSDTKGNFGFWLLPGNYTYMINYQGQVYGPYAFSVGGGSGGGGNPTNGTNGQGLTSNGSGGFGTPLDFAPSATTDTTNANNITSGTLAGGLMAPATSSLRGAVQLPPGATNIVLGAANSGIQAQFAIVDSAYATLPLACSAAAAANATLFVTKVWSSLSSQTLACDIQFLTGGLFQISATQTLTLTGAFTAPLNQVFDVSSVGSLVLLSSKTAAAYPQWFGGVTGTGLPATCTPMPLCTSQQNNFTALNAAQKSTTGLGIPIYISGRFEYQGPLLPANPGPGLQILSNTTWKGTTDSAELVANIAAYQPYAVVNFCGSLTEVPSVVECTENYPTSANVHGFNPALIGSTTLTANPSGGFSNITVGQWISVVEGLAPKWDTYRSYHRVTAIAGDVITLDRPTEFDFTGATDPSAIFGVILVNMIHDVVIDGIRLTKGNSNTIPYNLVTAEARNITIQNCIFASESATYAYAYGYATKSYKFKLLHNNWITGGFGGWGSGSFGIQDGDYELNMMGASHEEGQGSNHLTVVNSFFANATGLSFPFGGISFHYTIQNNQIQNMTGNIVFNIAGWDIKIMNNSVLDSYGGITFSSGAKTTDLLRTHDILISGNYINSRINAGTCLYYPIQGTAFNVVIVGNTFNCVHVNNWNGGILFADTNTITYTGNTEIIQNGVTPTAGLPGYTVAGALSGGPTTGGFATVPIYGGWLRSTYTVPGANPQTFNQGDVILPNYATAGVTADFALTCTTSGTTGTLSGVTATTVSGSNVITINGGTVIGQRYYTIAGVTGTKKLVFQLDATHWQMDSTANASVGPVAVAYAVPAFVKVVQVAYP